MDKYSTLDSVVRQLMLEQGENTERRYPVFLAYAYAFLNGEYPAQDGGGKTLKTVLIEMGYDREARLPNDYVELVSLGRIVGNKVRTLSYNAALVPEGIMHSAAKTGYGDMSIAPQATWPAITYWGWETLGLTGWDGRGYGWQWWVTADEHGTFWANGYEGQSVLVSPANDLVVVRIGRTDASHGLGLYDWRRRVVDGFAAAR